MTTDQKQPVARPVPRRGHLGPVGPMRIMAAEGAVLAVVAAATRGVLPGLVTAVIAVGLLAVVFARRQNRWWLEHHALVREHRRRRSARHGTSGAPALAALRTLAPGLTLHDVAGSPAAGIARDETGWFGVVRLVPPAPVPLDTLVGVLAATEQPGVRLSLVTHTVPAPSPDVPAASPAVVSYRQLSASIGPIPAYQESSISVRIDARALAESALDHTTDPASAAALTAALTRRTATALRRAGIAGRVLDAREVLALLARSCGTDDPELLGQHTGEEWTHWRSGRLAHRTYWLATWPESISEIGPLFGWASAAPAAQTSVALVLDATNADDVAVRAFLRLATGPDADPATLDRVLLEGARRAGGTLRPLDGQHGPAVWASAPTGGGAG